MFNLKNHNRNSIRPLGHSMPSPRLPSLPPPAPWRQPVPPLQSVPWVQTRPWRQAVLSVPGEPLVQPRPPNRREDSMASFEIPCTGAVALTSMQQYHAPLTNAPQQMHQFYSSTDNKPAPVEGTKQGYIDKIDFNNWFGSTLSTDAPFSNAWKGNQDDQVGNSDGGHQYGQGYNPTNQSVENAWGIEQQGAASLYSMAQMNTQNPSLIGVAANKTVGQVGQLCVQGNNIQQCPPQQIQPTYANLLKSSIYVGAGAPIAPGQNQQQMLLPKKPTVPVSRTAPSAVLKPAYGTSLPTTSNIGKGGNSKNQSTIGQGQEKHSLGKLSRTGNFDKNAVSRRLDRRHNLEGKQIFVGHIAQCFSEADLRAIFGRFGTISDVRIVECAPDKIPSGIRYPMNFGFITYSNAASVEKCLANLPLYYPENMLYPQFGRQQFNVEKMRPRNYNASGNVASGVGVRIGDNNSRGNYKLRGNADAPRAQPYGPPRITDSGNVASGVGVRIDDNNSRGNYGLRGNADAPRAQPYGPPRITDSGNVASGVGGRIDDNNSRGNYGLCGNAEAPRAQSYGPPRITDSGNVASGVGVRIDDNNSRGNYGLRGTAEASRAQSYGPPRNTDSGNVASGVGGRMNVGDNNSRGNYELRGNAEAPRTQSYGPPRNTGTVKKNYNTAKKGENKSGRTNASSKNKQTRR